MGSALGHVMVEFSVSHTPRLEYEGFETLNHAIIPTVSNFRISIGEPVFDVICGDLVISSVSFSYIYLF